MKKDYGKIKKAYKRIIAIALQIAFIMALLPISQAQAGNPVDYANFEVPEDFIPLSNELIEAQFSYDKNDPNTIVVTPQPAKSKAVTALPKVVDNSASKFFPIIEDQGVNGLCDSFAGLYYVYTYMTARQRNTDVKTLGKSVSFAPYQRFSNDPTQFGLVYWNEAPLGSYNYKSSLPYSVNYPGVQYETAPYTDAADWRNALKNKPSKELYIEGDWTVTTVQLLKQYLNDGYVFYCTIPTIGGFGLNTGMLSKDNPDSTLDDEFFSIFPFNMVFVKGDSTIFDHAVTLVGYNDDIWVDLNADNVMESEELGAFKFANSWGTEWGNDGYLWVSYDAMLKQSRVNGILYGKNRNPVIKNVYKALLPYEEPYTPQLLAEFYFKAIRNDKNIYPNTYFSIGCRPLGSTQDVKYEGYNYVGLQRPTDKPGYEGTRVFDLTDYVKDNNLDLVNKKYEWFLKIDYVSQDLSSDEIHLKDFKLTDANGSILASSAQELSFDGKTMSDGKNIYSNPKYHSSYKTYTFTGTMILNYGATARINGPWDVVWKKTMYDVTTSSLANNEVIESAQVLERDGYTFIGWYTDDRYANEAIFPYIVVDDVIFYAKWIRDGGTNLVYDINDLGAAIDLGSETLILPDGYSIAAYSTDGGSKWKQGSPNITSLLSKKLRLAISDTYDTGKKRPSVDSIILFPQIEARPKSNPDKLVINYAILDDKTGRTAGAWTLSKKGGKEAFTGNVEIALSQNKKTPDGNWMSIPEEGVPVQPYGSPKQTYLARTAPVAEGERYVPASKPFKLTPLTQQKALKLKPKYKYTVSGLLSNTEAFSLRPGDFIFGGSFETLKNTDNPVIVKSNKEFDTGVICEAERGGVPVSALLDKATAGNPAVVCIWKYATEKKPSSEIQEYTLAFRSVLSPQTITAASNGKITFPSTLEVYDKSKSKWGSLPKFTSTVTLEGAVRLKTTVRPTGKDDSSQLAASKPMDLTINYGVNPTTNKSGLLSIVISEPNAISTVQAEQLDIETLPQENDDTQDELTEQGESVADAA